jgi:hypothetical protein
MTKRLSRLGEDRHARCIHGDLTEAWGVTDTGVETPFVSPLCRYPTDTLPPAAARAWGGLVEFDRDCAVCPCYTEL